MSDSQRDQDRIRDAHQQLSGIAPGGCPASDRLYLAVRGELDAAENEALILHLGECPACAASFRIARELAGATRSPAANSPPRRMPARRFVTWIAAAAVLTAAGLGAYRILDSRTTQPVTRTQASEWLTSRLDESVALPRGAATLRWTAGPAGTRYDVLITDQTMSPLHRVVDLEEVTYLVPVAIFEELPSGATVYWQVTASLEDGRELRSETFVARIE